MAKYRNKPVEIEAFQWLQGTSVENIPDWLYRAWKESRVILATNDSNEIIGILIDNEACIPTVGDYIVRDITDGVYFCQQGFFEKLYEKV